MTYVVEPSSFGIGYSIFRLEVKDGNEVKTYVADVDSVDMAVTMLGGDNVTILCPAGHNTYSQLSRKAA
jgi:hypothetical protein